MIDIEALREDVFNPNESDLQYFLRRRRELGVDEMTGEITGFEDPDNPRVGAGGKRYIMIFFKMDDGGSAKSFLGDEFQNFPRWRPFLKSGLRLKGLVWKDKGQRLIDGDSSPKLAPAEPPPTPVGERDEVRRFPLGEAGEIADKFVERLTKDCSRIIIAGSIRRRRAFVKDIEILLISKRGGQIDPADLFKHEIARPAADIALDKLIENGTIVKRPNVEGHFTWGPENKLAVHVRSGIPIDFFSTTEAKWWNSLVVRTGPSKSNKAIAAAAIARGWHWHAYGEGFTRNDGTASIDRHKVESEEDCFHFVGLPCPPVHKR